MTKPANNSDNWNFESNVPSNFNEEPSLWSSEFFRDRSHLNQNGSISNSILPDLPSIWGRGNEEHELTNEFSNWSLNPNGSTQLQNSWNETASNLPQINSSNVPANDVFQNPWSDYSWRFLNQQPNQSSALNEASSQEFTIQPSNPQTQSALPQESTAAESDSHMELMLSQSNSATQPLPLTELDNLIRDRINNPGKWGSKPIKQNTPWYDDERVNRTTRQLPESNVWRSEPPTGTQIWDNLQTGSSTPTASLNGSVTSRISPQAISNSNQPPNFNNWNYPPSGSFPTRSQFPTQGVSPGFGPPGSFRRQMPSTGGTAIPRPNDIPNLGRTVGGLMSPRLNAWSSSNDGPGGNGLVQRSNTWVSRSNMDPTPPIGSFMDGHFTRGHNALNNIPNTPQNVPYYRNKLLNYFMQHGFNRADVEEVLASGITSIDQALAALRALQVGGAAAGGGNGLTSRGFQRTLTGTRLLSSPNAPSESGSFFGAFSNNQGPSLAQFARGNQMRTTTRSNSLNSGPQFNDAMGGGDDGYISSLLGRPPAQTAPFPNFLDGGAGPSTVATSGVSMRNMQLPGAANTLSLLTMKNDIQAKLSEFRDRPYLMNDPAGRKTYMDLIFQLQTINSQLNNTNATGGGFGPSPLSNGFRGPRHNSYTESFNLPGTSGASVTPIPGSGISNTAQMTEENWLLIRDMTTSVSLMDLGAILECAILDFHEFAVPGNYLLRVASAEIAREVKRRCETQFASIMPNVVLMTGEAAAGVLFESAKLKNPLPTAVFS